MKERMFCVTPRTRNAIVQLIRLNSLLTKKYFRLFRLWPRLKNLHTQTHAYRESIFIESAANQLFEEITTGVHTLSVKATQLLDFSGFLAFF